MSRIVRNGLYNGAYQLLTTLAPLVTAPYVARVLLPEGVGIYNHALAWATLFLLAGTLGTAVYGQREIAKVRDDFSARTRVFWQTATLRLVTVAASWLVFVLAVAGWQRHPDVFGLVSLEILAAGLDIAWFFQGLENFRLTTLRSIVFRLLSVALVFLCVKTRDDVPAYALCGAVPTLLSSLCLWPCLRGLVGRYRIDPAAVRRSLVPIATLFLPQIATRVYLQIDKTMLEPLASVAEVGYYTNAQHIVFATLHLVTSLSLALLPAVAGARARGDRETILRWMEKAVRYTLLLTFPLMTGLIAVATGLVAWFYGPDFARTGLLMQYASPLAVIMGLTSVLGLPYLVATDRQKEYTVAVCAGALVNIVLNALLIPRYRAVGATAATVAAETVILAIEFIVLRKELPLARWVFRALPCALPAAVMGLAVRHVGRFVQGPAGTAAQVAAGLAVYALLLLPTPSGKELAAGLLRLLRNRRR